MAEVSATAMTRLKIIGAVSSKKSSLCRLMVSRIRRLVIFDIDPLTLCLFAKLWSPVSGVNFSDKSSGVCLVDHELRRLFTT